MKWLRKSLLWASVGFVGTGTAVAQTGKAGKDAGVVLGRPRPLNAPTAFVVRAQMADAPASTPASGPAEPAVKPVQMLPDAAETASPVTPAQKTEGDGPGATGPDAKAPPGAASPGAAPQGAAPPGMAPDGKAPEGTRAFVPLTPPPGAGVPRYNPWSGGVEGLAPGATPVGPARPMVVYETWPGEYFDSVPTPRFYARAEYLQWFTKGDRLPVLVTTSSPTTPEATRGVLGDPATNVLFGGNSTSAGPRSGGRVTLGWSFDPCGTCGLEAGYFFLGRKHDNFFSNAPVLARPFFNVDTGLPDRELTATPGFLGTDNFRSAGAISVNHFSDLQGADLNLRGLCCAECDYTIHSFAGFRFLDLREGLHIGENITLLGLSPAAAAAFPQLTPGDIITVDDSFKTRNRFYGAQVGLDGELRRGRWFVGGRVQVGLGVTSQTIEIAGSQTITAPNGNRAAFLGGLLALPSNIGTFSQNRFSVVPQVGLKVGYNVTDSLRVFAGYDFLYWSSVVRPGDQIDTSLAGSQIPNFGGGASSGIIRPVVPFTTTSFYAHGLTAGLEWRY